MLKIIGRSKSITFLFAILLMAIGMQLPLHAGTNAFLFDMAAIKDPGSLAVKFQDTRAPISQSIVIRLSTDTQRLLREYDGASSPSADLAEALLTDLNQLLQTRSLYDPQSFVDVELSEETQALVAQNPQNGEALVRLNRFLLSDAYPYELASLSDQQIPKTIKRVEACRENLRQIKLARENYRIANADTDLQWLSNLVPEYLEQKVLLCSADATAGDPGVLTQEAKDPTLPCSYLSEMRPSQKTDQEILGMQEGDMIPIVRCEHHLLNLSVGGKLYRNGPQRGIYMSNKTEMSLLTDFLRDLRAQHGEAFLKTQKGRAKLKQATEELVIKKFVPKILSAFKKEINAQLEAQLGKSILNTAIGTNLRKQATGQVRDQINQQLQSQLETQLGSEFIKTEEGQDILKQLSALTDVFTLNGR